MNPFDIEKAKVIIKGGILICEKNACLETKLQECISQKVEVYKAKTANRFPCTYAQLTSTYQRTTSTTR